MNDETGWFVKCSDVVSVCSYMLFWHVICKYDYLEHQSRRRVDVWLK